MYSIQEKEILQITDISPNMQTTKVINNHFKRISDVHLSPVMSLTDIV